LPSLGVAEEPMCSALAVRRTVAIEQSGPVRFESVVLSPKMVESFAGDVAIAPSGMSVGRAAGGVGFLDKLRATSGCDAME
jgi:hypothetical protein